MVLNRKLEPSVTLHLKMVRVYKDAGLSTFRRNYVRFRGLLWICHPLAHFSN